MASGWVPLDETVKHSMTPWAKTVGGILKHNGFTDFLGNQQTRKAVDDPLRRAIGILGAVKPDKALRRRVGSACREAGLGENPDSYERTGH